MTDANKKRAGVIDLFIARFCYYSFLIFFYWITHCRKNWRMEFWQGWEDRTARNKRDDVERRYLQFTLGKITGREYLEYKRGWCVKDLAIYIENAGVTGA